MFRKPAYQRQPKSALTPFSRPPNYSGPQFSGSVEKTMYVRSKQYLKWVASLPCMNCFASNASQAAHPNSLEAGGSMGGKASDILAFPLCCERANSCHQKFDTYKLVKKADMPEVEKRWHAQTVDALILKSHEDHKLRALLVKLGLVR